MNVRLKHAALGVLCCCLTACQSSINYVVPAQPLDPSEVAFSEAVVSIDQSMQKLESDRIPRQKIWLQSTAPNPRDYNMGRMLAIDWIGPIEQLLQEVAYLTDYKFKVLGNAPAIPILVDISKDSVMAGDVIRMAQIQARKRADVVVYPRSKLIELHYKA